MTAPPQMQDVFLRPMYPGQHPAETVLDRIMLTSKLHDRDSRILAERYFDAKAAYTSAATPPDTALSMAAMSDLKRQVDALTADLDPAHGWSPSKGEVILKLAAIRDTFALMWNA